MGATKRNNEQGFFNGIFGVYEFSLVIILGIGDLIAQYSLVIIMFFEISGNFGYWIKYKTKNKP